VLDAVRLTVPVKLLRLLTRMEDVVEELRASETSSGLAEMEKSPVTRGETPVLGGA